MKQFGLHKTEFLLGEVSGETVRGITAMPALTPFATYQEEFIPVKLPLIL